MQPLLLETKIAGDVVPDDARVCERGSAKAGMDLVRDRAAPDFAAPFEHERLAARTREIGRRHQPVVARADDDRPHARSCRTACAALRPGAPMMPPPGCVAEPHM